MPDTPLILTANTPKAIPGTAPGATLKLTLINTTTGKERADVYVTSSVNVAPSQSSAVVSVGSSKDITATSQLFVWSAVAADVIVRTEASIDGGLSVIDADKRYAPIGLRTPLVSRTNGSNILGNDQTAPTLSAQSSSTTLAKFYGAWTEGGPNSQAFGFYPPIRSDKSGYSSNGATGTDATAIQALFPSNRDQFGLVAENHETEANDIEFGWKGVQTNSYKVWINGTLRIWAVLQPHTATTFGAAASTGASSVVLNSNATTTSGTFEDQELLVGTDRYRITAYDGSTKTATLATPLLADVTTSTSYALGPYGFTDGISLSSATVIYRKASWTGAKQMRHYRIECSGPFIGVRVASDEQVVKAQPLSPGFPFYDAGDSGLAGAGVGVFGASMAAVCADMVGGMPNGNLALGGTSLTNGIVQPSASAYAYPTTMERIVPPETSWCFSPTVPGTLFSGSGTLTLNYKGQDVAIAYDATNAGTNQTSLRNAWTTLKTAYGDHTDNFPKVLLYITRRGLLLFDRSEPSGASTPTIVASGGLTAPFAAATQYRGDLHDLAIRDKDDNVAAGIFVLEDGINGTGQKLYGASNATNNALAASLAAEALGTFHTRFQARYPNLRLVVMLPWLSTAGYANGGDDGILAVADALRTKATAVGLPIIDLLGNPLRSGSCQAGGTVSSAILDAGASATNDQYKLLTLVLRDRNGVLPAQVRMITAYNGTTKAATPVTNWSNAPGANWDFYLYEGTRTGTGRMGTAGTYPGSSFARCSPDFVHPPRIGHQADGREMGHQLTRIGRERGW